MLDGFFEIDGAMRIRYTWLCVVLLSAQALPNTVFEYRQESDADSARLIVAVLDQRLAISGNAAAAVMFDGDRGELLAIDHANRSYTVLDKAGIAYAAGEIETALEEMREQRATMSAEERALLDQLLDQSGAAQPAEAATRFEPIERTPTDFGGRACRWTRVTFADQSAREVCTADTATMSMDTAARC